MGVKRWQRYGKDRLYVDDHAGQPLGWWDLVTDEAHATSPSRAAELAAVVARWRAEILGPEPAPQKEPAATAAGPDFAAPEVWASQTGPSWLPADSPSAGQTEPVIDLIWQAPAQQLQGHVAAARAAGQRPTLLRRFFLGKHAYSTWERGAIGEQLVAEELARLVELDPRWGVLHSVPVGENNADIDHLLIGPGGIFPLNTKHHRGCNVWVGGDTYMVNGQRQQYVRNSRFEARRVGRLLGRAVGAAVDATGVIVVVNPRALTVRQQPDGVHVVGLRRLVDWLLHQPPRMGFEDIAILFDHARLGHTWSKR